MAIPGFFGAYIKQLALRYKQILRSYLPNGKNTAYISSLSIDANALFYTAVAPIYFMGGFKSRERIRQLNSQFKEEEVAISAYELVCKLIVQIVSQVAPRDAVVIAVDGAIPLSKVQQQKRRRYKSSLELEADATFDTNSITPGTSFMIGLNNYIRAFFEKNFVLLGVQKLIYSSYKVEGEGEHKIFEYFRNGDVDVSDDQAYHVVYGMDADLIMLCLVSQVNNLILARDSIDLMYGKEFLNDTKDRNNIYINDLRSALESEIVDETEHTAETRLVFHDFILAMTLLGNDFIPKPFSLTNMRDAVEQIIRTLRAVKPLYRMDGSLNIKNFLSFLKIIANEEPEYLMKLGQEPYTTKIPYLNVAREKGSDIIDIDKFRGAWYSHIFTPKRQVPGMESITVSTEIAEMAYHFLHGMFWTHSYYTGGMNAVSWLWYYPYSYAPLLRDVYAAASHMLSDENLFRTEPLEGEMRINILHQLVAVMPYPSLRHVPIYLRELWLNDSPIADLMPCGFILDTTVYKYEDQAIPLIPLANYERIANAVADLNITEKTYEIIKEENMVIISNEMTQRDVRLAHKAHLKTFNEYQASLQKAAMEEASGDTHHQLPESSIDSRLKELVGSRKAPVARIVRRRNEGKGKFYKSLPAIDLS